ncbi:MAG: hypothetical protein ACXWQR_04910 [Ktedonobacterales bacterium]
MEVSITLPASGQLGLGQAVQNLETHAELCSAEKADTSENSGIPTAIAGVQHSLLYNGLTPIALLLVVLGAIR